jgi:hypothetical protein
MAQQQVRRDVLGEAAEVLAYALMKGVRAPRRAAWRPTHSALW